MGACSPSPNTPRGVFDDYASIIGDKPRESSVESFTQGQQKTTLSEQENSMLLDSIITSDKLLKGRSKIVAGHRPVKIFKRTPIHKAVQPSSKKTITEQSSRNSLNSICEEPMNLSLKTIKTPSSQSENNCQLSTSNSNNYIQAPLPKPKNINQLSMSSPSTRKRKICEEEISADQPRQESDQELSNGNISWIFDILSENNTKHSVSLNDAIREPESRENNWNLDLDDLTNAPPNVASTPCKTPNKKRRKSHAACLPIQVKQNRDLSTRRRSSSVLIPREPTTVDTPRRSESAENLRPARLAKSRATLANERLLTTVIAESESSIEDMSTGSLGEMEQKSSQSTMLNMNPPGEFMKWRCYRDGPNADQLFTNKDLMKRFKPMKFDPRTKEEFEEDLRKIGEILQTNFASEYHKDYIAKGDRIYVRTSFGRYSHCTSDDIKKLEDLVMGKNKVLDIKSFVEEGNHSFIKNNYRDYVNDSQLAKKQQRKLREWFASKKRSRLVHCKDKYLSLVTQMARKGRWKIEKCLNGEMDAVLAKAKMNSPKKRMELEAFQAKLRILSDVLTNEDSLLELALTNPSQLYRVIPCPTSTELCDLLIDYVLRDPTKQIKKIGRARCFVMEQARKRGLIITQRSISRQEIRSFIADKNQAVNGKNMTPISVIQVSQFLDFLPVAVKNLINETLINIILTNTNFEKEFITKDNLQIIMKDKKGKAVITQIIHFLNRSPLNWLKIITEEVELGHMSNSILRMPPKAQNPKKTNPTLDNSDESQRMAAFINDEIRQGKIPKPKLIQNIADPTHFINFELGINTDNLLNFKSQLGRIVHNIQSKKKEKSPNAESNIIINPTNEDIHKLMNECNEKNKEENEKLRSLSIILSNPGQIDTLSMRDLQDHLPDRDLYMLNELGIKSKTLKDAALIHPDYKLYFNDTCPNRRTYTAFLVKKELAHLITQLRNVGTATTLQFDLGQNGKINLSCLYRNIERNDDSCFYKCNYDSTCIIFLQWIKDILDLAKATNAESILAGDLNLDLINPRTKDDKVLVGGLNFALRNHSNVIKFDTFFRENCKGQAIDYFFMKNPRGVNVKALNLHKEPLRLDGHTGHEIKFKRGGLGKLYEVKISYKYDEDKIRVQSIKEAEALRNNNMLNPNDYIEESFRIMSKIVADNQTRTARVAPKVRLSLRKQPMDTKKYYAALNFTNKHLFTNEENPEFKFTEQEKELLKKYTRNLGIMLRKLQRRDNEKLEDKVKEVCLNPINAAWKITGELLGEEPVRELTENVEELMDQVIELQKNTTLDPSKYTKHYFNPKKEIKLKDFQSSVHPQKGWKCSIWSEYKKLKDFTKGSTGLSKKILDCFHISTFYTLIAKPILLAIIHGLYAKCWRTNRTIILAKKKGIRPISISELFAKILEKIIVEQMTEFIEFNGLLPSEQNGFRKNLSTGTSIAAVNMFICSGLDKGKTVGVFCVDMKNAFGTPYHGNLVKCFSNLFEGNALKIISASLERWAIVNKDGTFSRKEKMEEFGVPQGSVVSPLLFCLYISEIINILNKEEEDIQINIFADDTVVSVCGNNFEDMKDRAERILDTLGNKLEDIGLQLVPEKTSILILDKKDKEVRKAENLRGIRIVDQEIPESDKLKYLGSTLGKSKGILDYEINNENKMNRMKIMINRVRSIKNYIGNKAAWTIHRSFCMGVLNHNYDVLPKWRSKQHNKGQNLYIKGCGAGRDVKWYYKKEEFEKVKRDERIALLSLTGHPSFYESQIKLFHGQIAKTIRYRKCTTLALELDKCLMMFCVNSGEKIGPLPDVFVEHRELEDFTYFKTRHNIACDPNIKRSTCIMNELIITMIELEHLELKLIPDKNVGKIKKEICWPYNLHKDFHQLPKDLRNAIISRKNKTIIKSHFEDRHKHTENKYDCEDCINDREIIIPEFIENPSFNSFNNSVEHELIEELKKERLINMADSRHENILIALEETGLKRPEFEISGVVAEWARTGSKNLSLKRCLDKIKLLLQKHYDK
ncbi:unnamed protein product [Oikopleura dioica]|uniref:Reverse transcriptase domain-containing protein n=1 Tax=Oikopleura dioica TaxID=34765 RepID=E4XS39_OIKDI|nr:unnamed protein product [Oikopleura dioica]